jgi:hypothetical protein
MVIGGKIGFGPRRPRHQRLELAGCDEYWGHAGAWREFGSPVAAKRVQ